jgi:hypothetical protein
VALEGGQVLIYNDKCCVAKLAGADTITGACLSLGPPRLLTPCGRSCQPNDDAAILLKPAFAAPPPPPPSAAMRFGRYSRESNTLALVSRSGALTFKMIKRTASFLPPPGGGGGGGAGAPPEQDTPLAVPKKSRVYMEQTAREREAATPIHRAFQLGLRRLRLATARAFVKTAEDGGGVSSLATVSGASLRLNVLVAGLGPRFLIKIDLAVRSGEGVEMRSLYACKLFDLSGVYVGRPGCVSFTKVGS